MLEVTLGSPHNNKSQRANSIEDESQCREAILNNPQSAEQIFQMINNAFCSRQESVKNEFQSLQKSLQQQNMQMGLRSINEDQGTLYFQGFGMSRPERKEEENLELKDASLIQSVVKRGEP